MKFLILIGLLSASLTRAENGAASGVTEAEAPKIVFKKEESHKFNHLKLKGQLKKPDLSYIYKRKGVRGEEIIDIPDNFNEEISQGAGQF